MTKTSAAARQWIKYSGKRGFDSAARCQRNLFAFRVMLTMTGGRMVCPACKRPMVAGNVEVDRTIGGQSDERGEVYTEGFVTYLCGTCNHKRGLLQGAGKDWAHVDAYRAAVLAASALVDMPTTVEAKRWMASGPWPLADEEVFINKFE